MEKESVWLGSFRGPVKMAMLGFGALTFLIYVWLVLNRIISPDAIGMHEMIRPAGRPVVSLMLASVGATILFTSLYLSDFNGAIEPEPHGFFDILSLVTSRMAMIMVALVVIVMF